MMLALFIFDEYSNCSVIGANYSQLAVMIHLLIILVIGLKKYGLINISLIFYLISASRYNMHD